MTGLDPHAVAETPQLAILELLGAMIETGIVALLAAHPLLDRHHPARWCQPDAPSACCFAAAVVDLLYQLDDALIQYRDLLDAELHAAQSRPNQLR
jgi:hypothetical protein